MGSAWIPLKMDWCPPNGAAWQHAQVLVTEPLNCPGFVGHSEDAMAYSGGHKLMFGRSIFLERDLPWSACKLLHPPKKQGGFGYFFFLYILKLPATSEIGHQANFADFGAGAYLTGNQLEDEGMLRNGIRPSNFVFQTSAHYFPPAVDTVVHSSPANTLFLEWPPI